MFSRSKSVVGLDIGSSAVKLVELKERKGGDFQLQRLGMQSLSPEAIVDGSIMDSALVVDAIQKLNRETGTKTASYATSLSGHSVIIKKIQVPAMDEDELAESLQWEAEQYIPFDINDVRLDYVVLEGDAGPGEMEVLLVAVKRDKVNDYVSVITQSGRNAALVDVDAFAVQNAYEANYDFSDTKVIALVNMGSSVTNINILASGSTVFWRDLSFGGNQFTEALQREFSLSYEQARGSQARRGGRPVLTGRGALGARRGLRRDGCRDREDLRVLRGDLLGGPGRRAGAVGGLLPDAQSEGGPARALRSADRADESSPQCRLQGQRIRRGLAALGRADSCRIGGSGDSQGGGLTSHDQDQSAVRRATEGLEAARHGGDGWPDERAGQPVDDHPPGGGSPRHRRSILPPEQ